MKNPHNWLIQELPYWVGREIISQQQADKILTLYPARSSVSWGKMLISAFGAVMIGLGVILLFAYNWDEMSRFAKMGVILGVLGLTHLFAYRAKLQSKYGLSESLFVLATMLFGAGIWLVAQVYHLDEHYPNAFLLWSSAALIFAWALPSLAQAVMAVLLILVWHMVEVFDFHNATDHALILILLGVFPLIWILRSPLLAKMASASFLVSLSLTTLTVDEHLPATVILMAASGFIFIGHLTAHLKQPLQHIGEELAKPAYLAYIVILFLLSFHDLTDDLLRVRFDGIAEYFYFYTALAFSQLMFLLLLFKRIFNPVIFAIELTLLVCLYPAILSLFYDVQAEALIFNVLLLILAVGLIVEGSRKADKQKMIWGSLILSLLVFARYTDLFDSLISRAIAFLLVGAGLFIAGNIYNRNRQDSP